MRTFDACRNVRPTKADEKVVLLAAILVAGLLATAFAATQLTASATAQSEDNSQTNDNGQMTSMEEHPATSGEGAQLISAPLNDTNKSTLSVTGMATTKTQPDKFSVTLGVETNATTAAAAASSNAEVVNATVAALTGLGISQGAIASSSYNLFPVYSSVAQNKTCIQVFPPSGCEPSQEITGYKASSSLTVTLDTEGSVDAGTVIDTAIGAGANNVSGLFFFVSPEKQQEVRDSLIADAIADARHKADVASAALEMHVSGIHSVSLEEVHFPIFARGAEAMQADTSTRILPGEQEVTSSVSITYIITPGAAQETGSAGAEIQEGIGIESSTEAGGEVSAPSTNNTTIGGNATVGP